MRTKEAKHEEIAAITNLSALPNRYITVRFEQLLANKASAISYTCKKRINEYVVNA